MNFLPTYQMIGTEFVNYYFSFVISNSQGNAIEKPNAICMHEIDDGIRCVPVAYAIHSPSKQMLLAHPNSWHGKRAKYAFHPFWVTAHRDNELYPAGDYTYQSLPDGKSDLGAWVDRKDSTKDTDIVVWHSISLTHNPRTEDYPVMPCK
jgi:Cu2+-containing amine oxidase